MFKWLLILLLISGNCMAQEMDPKKLSASIKNYQETMVDAGQKWGGRCHAKAMQSAYSHQRNDEDVRICMGKFEGRPHAWMEYYEPKTKEWLVEDNSIWYINNGYRREAYGESYEVNKNNGYYYPDYTKDK